MLALCTLLIPSLRLGAVQPPRPPSTPTLAPCGCLWGIVDIPMPGNTDGVHMLGMRSVRGEC